MAQKIKIDNGTNVNCFVPSCSNKKIIDGNPIHFFQVPEGNEGLRWRLAVNFIHSPDRIECKSTSKYLHCCEVHFNIETDSVVTIDMDGFVECNIKPGILPKMKATRSKRLCEILGNDETNALQEMNSDDTNNDLLQPLENLCDTEVDHSRDFISMVDMSTLICKNFKDTTTSLAQVQVYDMDDQMDTKFMPLMPLTVELMRRKSFYYMGLEPSLFFRLLQIIKGTVSEISDPLVETKIMLTLRKHRLNEEFEALGDLFDIDKTTAQRYYAESKNLLSNLFHSLTSSLATPISKQPTYVKNPLLAEKHYVSKYKEEKDESSSELEVKYKGYVNSDSSIDSNDFNDHQSESDDIESDDIESDNSDYRNSELELEPKEILVKEKVKCPLCGKTCGRLEYHMETNHLNPQYLNKTICGLCFQKFRTHQKLRAHQIDAHNGNACVCDVCGKSFKKFSAAKEHILKVHSKLKPFLCHFCAAGFFSLGKLKIHTHNVHLQIRNHECNLCAKKYLQATELQAHIRSMHTKERPFQCRFEGCAKSFCRSGSRHTHEQMHKVHFSCEICSKVFSFRHNLQTHCKNIHGKNVIDTEKCKIKIRE